MRREGLVCLVLAVVTLAVFAPAASHDFINVDDNTYVTANPHVQQGLAPAAIRWAFTSKDASNWHPLTWLSHMLDYQLYGLKPAGHHFTNILFHAANTVLLFLFFQRHTGSLWRSALVAALFAWHPLRVESVAWVAERKDVLSTFFWLLTLLAYGGYVGGPMSNVQCPMSGVPPSPGFGAPSQSPMSPGYYSLAVFCFALGLLAKPMVVTLPFVLLLLDYWPLGRLPESALCSPRAWWRLILEKLPFFALSAASCLMTFKAQNAGGAVMSVESETVTTRLGNALVSYMRYIGKMFWPENLAVFYPMTRWPVWLVVLAAGLILGASALAILTLNRRPYFAVGWFWYLGTLVPVIGLVQVGGQSMADRYTYVPMIGLFLIVAWIIPDVQATGMRLRIATGAVIAVLLAGCIGVTEWQLRFWTDSESLWRRAIATTANNNFADLNLGLYLQGKGRLDEAMTYYAAALKSGPRFKAANAKVASFLEQTGTPDEAQGRLQTLLQVAPDYVEARLALAKSLMRQNKLDESAQEWSTVLERFPADAEANLGLGMILAKQGRMPEALSHIKAALQSRPNWTPALQTLGQVLAAQGDSESAIASYLAAIQSDPTNADIHAELAMVLSKQHRMTEAVAQYHEALRLKPDSPATLNNLAWILAAYPDPKIRNGAEAVRLAEHASDLTHYQSPVVLSTLATAYAEAGRFPEAVTTIEKASQAALATGRSDVAARNQELLQLFRDGKTLQAAAH